MLSVINAEVAWCLPLVQGGQEVPETNIKVNERTCVKITLLTSFPSAPLAPGGPPGVPGSPFGPRSPFSPVSPLGP